MKKFIVPLIPLLLIGILLLTSCQTDQENAITLNPVTTDQEYSTAPSHVTDHQEYSTTLNSGTTITSDGNFVYYSSNSDVNGIYRVKIGTNEKTKIYDHDALNLNLWEGYLYFSTFADGNYMGEICRIKTDGTNKQMISNDYTAESMLVSYGKIFYTSAPLFGCQLYSMDLDGKNKKTISTDYVCDLSIADGNLFYTVTENKKNQGFWKLPIDEELPKKISSTEIDQISLFRKEIYYSEVINEEEFPYRFKVFKLGQSGKEEIMEGNLIQIFKNSFYLFQGGQLIKTNPNGKDEKVILENKNSIRQISVLNDEWIFCMTDDEEGVFINQLDSTKNITFPLFKD